MFEITFFKVYNQEKKNILTYTYDLFLPRYMIVFLDKENSRTAYSVSLMFNCSLKCNT